jgi:hypothetical protein
LRLVEAMVEIDGKPKRMTFIIDNFTWAASSICDLYKARWSVNENAVRWQIWTALLTYILLRFIAWQSKGDHSFARLFTALCGVLWSCLDMFSVLACCGTAGGRPRMRSAPTSVICRDLHQYRLNSNI